MSKCHFVLSEKSPACKSVPLKIDLPPISLQCITFSQVPWSWMHQNSIPQEMRLVHQHCYVFQLDDCLSHYILYQPRCIRSPVSATGRVLGYVAMRSTHDHHHIKITDFNEISLHGIAVGKPKNGNKKVFAICP